MNIRQITQKMKDAAPLLAAATKEQRNSTLRRIRDTLCTEKESIFAANAVDLARAENSRLSDAVKKRLLFDEHKLQDILAGLEQLIDLPDPLHRVTLKRELDNGLILHRETCPIGVVGVIFEARPDALVQIACLCLKSGNCAILKGGKEAEETNATLFRLIRESASALPPHILAQAKAHSEIDELLTCDDTVDLLIPRGSNAFVQYILSHTNIPVLGHADGVCHTYVDIDARREYILPVLTDAKTQYTAACNATETILVHRGLAEEELPRIGNALRNKGVVLYGTEEVASIIPVNPIPNGNFHHEYGDLAVSLAIVDNADAAIAHINRYGSHHTDAILTDNQKTAERFTALVDSANVYVNASTRFADGFRYGFGAEVGISTSKIHARGPVGLDGLLSYKYILSGKGHVVSDYATGAKSFHFRDL